MYNYLKLRNRGKRRYVSGCFTRSRERERESSDRCDVAADTPANRNELGGLARLSRMRFHPPRSFPIAPFLSLLSRWSLLSPLPSSSFSLSSLQFATLPDPWVRIPAV